MALSPDDRLFKDLRQRYYEAKAAGDNVELQRLRTKSWHWLLEYCDQKVSRHKGAMLRRGNAYKAGRHAISNAMYEENQKKKPNENTLRALRRIENSFTNAWFEAQRIDKLPGGQPSPWGL